MAKLSIVNETFCDKALDLFDELYALVTSSLLMNAYFAD